MNEDTSIPTITPFLILILLNKTPLKSNSSETGAIKTAEISSKINATVPPNPAAFANGRAKLLTLMVIEGTNILRHRKQRQRRES